MQKGFGSAPKKKFLKDSRYLKFYNDEKHAEDLLKNKKHKEARNLYLNLLKSGYQSYKILFNLGFIEINQKNYKDAILKTIKAGGCNCSRVNFIGAYFAALKGVNAIPKSWIRKTAPARKILDQK